jgi:hypothetical protein
VNKYLNIIGDNKLLRTDKEWINIKTMKRNYLVNIEGLLFMFEIKLAIWVWLELIY